MIGKTVVRLSDGAMRGKVTNFANLVKTSSRSTIRCARFSTMLTRTTTCTTRSTNANGLRAVEMRSLAAQINSGSVRHYSESLDISEYHQLSDEALEHMLDQYELLAEDVAEIDVELAQGVLTLVLPGIGTYVINKQPPNKQIWLSSPISGPKRYDYVDGAWVYSRDGSTLGDLLRQETKLVTDERGCDNITLEELK
uniref:ferroxidase n=1 Tax=Blastobotrys adeninivorans TaxID=409370 RepID=A0A060T4R1_BLAAD